jgi:ORF6N domain
MQRLPLALSPSSIAPKVQWIRHEKVILDFDLAALYGVEARALNQAVRRNLARFPDDFMFQLTAAEADEASRLVSQSATPAPGDTSNSSQFVMSSRKHRGRAYRPYAFTEQGVAMNRHGPLGHPAALALINTSLQRGDPGRALPANRFSGFPSLSVSSICDHLRPSGERMHQS